MLSNVEQRILTESNAGLRSKDRDFGKRFSQVTLRCPQEFRGMTARGWLLAAALSHGHRGVDGSGGVALIALSVTGMSTGIWLNRYIGSSDGRKPPRL
jgi:hypothetical protein